MVFNRQRTYTEPGLLRVIATTNAFYAVGVGSAWDSRILLQNSVADIYIVKFN
jgi:hypothetical protein